MTYPPPPGPDGTYPPPPDPPVQAYQPPEPYQPPNPYQQPVQPYAPPQPSYDYSVPDYGAPQSFNPPQPYGAPQSYDKGYPGSPYSYQAGSPYAPARPTEGLAIASLVVSCAAVFGFCLYGLGSVVGIVGAILGHVARRKIRANGYRGAGMALAGIIIGWVVTAIGLVILAFLIIALVTDGSTGGGSTF